MPLVKESVESDSLIGNALFYFRWFLKSVCIPISLPWFIYTFIQNIRLKKQRASLQDKVVVITGASSGIGEAIAHSFYARGCRLVLAARRIDELNRVKSDLLRTHSTVPTHPPVVMKIDLSELNSLSDHVTEILKIFGQIDILINNGGISYRGCAFEGNIDVDIKVMTVNYFAQIALTKAVIPHMIKRKSGHLVYMSSLQGMVALPYRSAYGASKHALQTFCDSLRVETEKHNLKVTVISPSYVKTSLSMNALTGNGNKHGQMDDSTNKGVSPEVVAERTLDAVASGKKHVLIAPFMHQLFVFTRTIWPALHEYGLKKYEKTTNPNINSKKSN